MYFKSYYRFYVSAILLFAASCSNKQSQQQQGPPSSIAVTTEVVQPTKVVYFDEYPGSVVALNEVKLTSQVTGFVTAIYCKDGNSVRKGQKLYSIDAQVYNANYQQSVADLQVQEANLIKAQKDADRYHELDKHDAIAKQQVDYADAALESAKKQVAAAQANVAALKSNINFSTIYAPFEGTIGISQVKIGTLVVTGQTVLNTISSNNPIAVDFALDQKNIYRFLQIQQKNGDREQDSTFTISFSGTPYLFPGQISFIDRAVNTQTGTITARLIFPNGKGMLKPGMNTTVRVRNSPTGNSTIITNKAITEQLGEFFVYKLGDSNKVHQQKIQLGTTIGSKVIVTSGLTEGDNIVVEGVQNLHEGSKVTIGSQQGSPPNKN